MSTHQGGATPAGAWSPFRYPDFALLWSAALLSNTGSWMHDVAAGWLMTTLAPTPLMVALVQAATTLPVFLLALPAGALADRCDRRRLLMLVQACMLLLAALLGVLVLAGAANTAALLAITFGLGVGTAISSPTWQAILPQLVPRANLPPAVALHAVGMNLARAIGPAIGGLLIVVLGIAWPFFLNAVSFVAIIVALWHWRPAAVAPRAVTQESLIASMLAGVRHAAANRSLRNTLLRAVAFYIFASAYWALLPLVARQQLAGDARLYGVLVGCIGTGAVAGALALPRLRQRFGLDGTLIAGTVGTALALAGYALLRVQWLGMLASLVAGASWLAALSSLNVAAQLAVPDFIRARGMALYTAVFYGCLAAGSVLWGQVATRLTLACALLLAAGGALLALAPARRLPLHRPT
ncbi:MAG TPA: MFS transporter [Steroidobacteraceae bacterium]|nr:MFS transporter [Steroidobacteraceae bacterium]